MSSLCHHDITSSLHHHSQYDIAGFEKMPLLEALNGYKLKLPSEVEEDEEEEREDRPGAKGEEEGEGETEEEGAATRVPNGTPASAAISVT